MTIPNIITLFRIALTPVFLTVLYSNMKSKLIIMIIIIALSALSDVLDGFIARKFNMKSKLGAVLDPIADKLMQLVVLLFLLKFKLVPSFLVIFICLKEVVLSCGAIHLLRQGFEVSSDKSGKIATFTFYLCSFIFIFLQPVNFVRYILFTILIITSIYALIDYSIIFANNTNIFKRNDNDDREKQS